MYNKKKLDTFSQHQERIAIATLKMNNTMVPLMSGMTTKEAINFLISIGYTKWQIEKLNQ